MARRDVLNILGLLFLMNFMNYCLCLFDNYIEYGLESEKICHILGKTSTLDLKHGAAIVRARHMFDRWNVRNNVHCKFKFKTSKGDGLFGVIQKMSFRGNETHCLDYVRFKRKDYQETKQFCGIVDRKTDHYSIEDKNLNNNYHAEYDPITHKSAAELETEIFISKKELQEGESLILSIAYTSFTNCSTVDSGTYKSFDHNSCMLNDFYCDGIYNCMPEVCFDEGDCPEGSNEVTSTGTGTKVTISAVTTLILCFIIFVMCLWICKRSHKVCWAVECNHSGVCLRPGHMPGDPVEASVNPPVPTAPMLEVAVSPSVADKDLPPSYDSLFPEQSNTTVRSQS